MGTESQSRRSYTKKQNMESLSTLIFRKQQTAPVQHTYICPTSSWYARDIRPGTNPPTFVPHAPLTGLDYSSWSSSSSWSSTHGAPRIPVPSVPLHTFPLSRISRCGSICYGQDLPICPRRTWRSRGLHSHHTPGGKQTVLFSSWMPKVPSWH